jgi:hypothetical protein
MSAFPTPDQPTDFSKQAPLTLNEGFVRPQEQAQAIDPLDDDEMIAQSAMDARGSRQIAPYATFDVVQQALENGYYTGLEAMDFGTLPDGTPAALFTDQNGMRQAVRMAPDRWFAAIRERADARVSMAKKARNARDAKRLRPAIADMAKEIEAIAPGFMEFADIGLEENAPQTYATVQDVYRRLQEKDETELRKLQAELQGAINGRQMQTIQGLADNFVQNTVDEMDLRAEGFMSNQSIPEEVRMMRALDLRRQQESVKRFGYLIPPASQVARTASFPSFYFSQGNPGALDDLADMSVQTLGYDNLTAMPQQQRVPMLMQQAQTLARNIGWSLPFNEADIQIMSQVMTDRLLRLNRPIMAPTGESEAVAGGLARVRASRAEQELSRQEREAKIQSERARGISSLASAERATASAERTRMMTPSEIAKIDAFTERMSMMAPAERERVLAQIEKMQSETERTEASTQQTRAETQIMRGEQPTAQITRSQDDELRSRASEMGLNVPEGVPILDFLVDESRRLAKARDPQSVAKLREIHRIVYELQTR